MAERAMEVPIVHDVDFLPHPDWGLRPPYPPRTGSFEEFADGKSGDRLLETRLLAVMDEAFKLWQTRHKKYGRGNIAGDGALGCQVRCADKIARLREVYQHQQGISSTDESVEDSWVDLFNYALMGLMCERGLWPGVEGRLRHTATVSTPRRTALDLIGMQILPGRVIKLHDAPSDGYQLELPLEINSSNGLDGRI